MKTPQLVGNLGLERVGEEAMGRDHMEIRSLAFTTIQGELKSRPGRAREKDPCLTLFLLFSSPTLFSPQPRFLFDL